VSWRFSRSLLLLQQLSLEGRSLLLLQQLSLEGRSLLLLQWLSLSKRSGLGHVPGWARAEQAGLLWIICVTMELRWRWLLLGLEWGPGRPQGSGVAPLRLPALPLLLLRELLLLAWGPCSGA
jgi:hypothetical protein